MTAEIVKSPFKHPWWGPFCGIGDTIKCLDEWLVIDVSNEIRAKPDWNSKYNNADIVSKWRAELNAQAPKTKHLDAVFDYVLRELQWYDKLEKSLEFEQRKFKFGPDDKIVYSDGAIDATTASEVKSGVLDIEANTEKDYHPGLNNLVVDIVHPSLYHLEYGRTKVLNDGKLEVAEFNDAIVKVKKSVAWGVSMKFQWLPAELKLDSSKKFVFDSYINNLHPVKYAGLYKTISDIFNQIVPGLNMTLSRYASKEYVRIPIPGYTDVYNDQFEAYQEELWSMYDKPDFSTEKEAEMEAKRADYVRDFPPTYIKDPETTEFDVRDFSNLKVVVKLANIELTPEQPKYPGGSWHVEGTINEDIVATVLYYYDMENIKDSKLSFRMAFDEPHYEQGDEFYCEHFFGLKDEDKMTHSIGSVNAVKGRVVIFPNTFQHHVDEFELEDPLKPGYRKILCFFLVDPYNEMVKSTKVVPPQQKEWVTDTDLMKKYFPSIKPEDISTISAQRAKELRDELMEERRADIGDEDEDDYDNAFRRLFSLCEH